MAKYFGKETKVVKTVNTVSPGLAKLAKQFPQWAAQALNEEAEETMAASKELVPVGKTGRLRRSGRARHATPKHLKAWLTYSTDYALAVHEIPAPPAKSSPGKRSATHIPPTQWKYLEAAVNGRASMFSKRIASEMKKKLAASTAGV